MEEVTNRIPENIS